MDCRTRSRLAPMLSTATALALLSPLAPADLGFDGASWDGVVGIKVSASGAGSLTVTIPAQATFSGSDFQLLDGVGSPLLTGTYLVLSTGKAEIDLDEAAADAFLTNWIETELFSALGVTGSVTSLDVSAAAAAAKAKTSASGIALKLKGKVQAAAMLDVPAGTPLESKVNLSIKFAGLIPPDITGTHWIGSGKSKVSSPGQGSESGSGPIEMYFGPYAGTAAAGEFVFVDVAAGITLTGMTYAQTGNVATISGFAAEIGTYVQDFLELVLGVSVVMTVAGDETTVTYIPCKKAKIASVSVYDVSIPAFGEQIQVFFTVKGKATPSDGTDAPGTSPSTGTARDPGLLVRFGSSR